VIQEAGLHEDNEPRRKERRKKKELKKIVSAKKNKMGNGDSENPKITVGGISICWNVEADMKAATRHDGFQR